MNTYMHTDDNTRSHKTLVSEGLGGLLPKDYLTKFRVFKSRSLFEPDAWDLTYWLRQMRCPICQRKLYWDKNKTKAFCKSKFKDKFFIRKQTLEKFK